MVPILISTFNENSKNSGYYEYNYRKNKGQQLIDENTLTFVALHELAHIMTKSVGHTEEFWDNFKFLLENAKECNVHQPRDYKKDPVEYCGMDIHDNPYYDHN